VESLASHRPYRPALGLDVALRELEKNTGKLYDSQAVDALMNLVKEKNYTLPAATVEAQTPSKGSQCSI